MYRTKSNAWDFFTKIDTTHARCNICKKIFKNCGNTTNFLIHIKKQHEVEFNKQYLSGSDSEGLCSEDSKSITSTNVCVSDGWTSNANESYLGITCHFFKVTNFLTLHSTTLDVILIEKDETANNLSQLIRNCLTDWEIFDKVNHIVTDNAANMKLTVELLNKKHFPCFAHSLNLVLKNAITKCNNKEVLSIITKCKNLVTFFHHSSKASRMLKEANKKLAEEGETVPCKLIQYIDTRWNTLYHMINSIIDNHNGIKLIQLNDEYSELPILTKEEIQLTKQINMILEPFEQATKDISGEDYVSISLVIPCIKGIILKLEAIHKTLSYPAALSFYEKIRQFIDEKLIHYEQRTIGKVATLIDPRFKKIGFRSQANYEEAVNMLQNLLAAQFKSSDQIEKNVNLTHFINNKTNNCSVAKPTGIFSFMEHSSQSSVANIDNIVLTRNYLT
ncbi:zinc finger BED domain-containing protein 6-like, partial [Nylanderia fulva]|uniref:zinc finger BED domain-containing protein 6-like n=1 Tax=Nylanderia fulva TaxID=613905 RepID=UPI0010FBA3F1